MVGFSCCFSCVLEVVLLSFASFCLFCLGVMVTSMSGLILGTVDQYSIVPAITTAKIGVQVYHLRSHDHVAPSSDFVY